MSRKIIGIIIFIVVILTVHFSMAEEPGAKPKDKILKKTISGEVSGISSNFIAIVYDQDKKISYEMAMTVDKDTKVEHKDSLRNIKPGDTVSVEYEEVIENIDEKNNRIKSRIVKTITFLRAAPEGLRSETEVVKPVTLEEEIEEQIEIQEDGE